MRPRVAAGFLGVVAAATAPLWGPWALRPFDFFAVRRVEVVGARFLASRVLVDALGMGRDASVWDRLGPMQERVQALPGVEAASVGRVLPGTVRIVVREVEPVALAAGAQGLVPLGADARPLPYDPASVQVDVPVVERADPSLVAALDVVRSADASLFGTVASARRAMDGEVRLELDGGGTLRLRAPVDPAVVRALAAVGRDLASRSLSWRELDGRFGGWVVVRRPANAEASS